MRGNLCLCGFRVIHRCCQSMRIAVHVPRYFPRYRRTDGRLEQSDQADPESMTGQGTSPSLHLPASESLSARPGAIVAFLQPTFPPAMSGPSAALLSSRLLPSAHRSSLKPYPRCRIVASPPSCDGRPRSREGGRGCPAAAATIGQRKIIQDFLFNMRMLAVSLSELLDCAGVSFCDFERQ